MVNQLIRSATYLLLDKGFRLIWSFVVGILVIRHFDPSTYGQLSYVVSFASIFGSLSSLGMDDIIPKDLSFHKKYSPSDILYTALLLRIFSGVMIYLLCLTIFLFKKDNSSLILIAAIYGLYIPLQSTDVIDYRLRSINRFDKISFVRSSAAILSGIFKIYIIFNSLSIEWLAVAMLSEFSIQSILFLYTYIRLDFGKVKKLIPNYLSETAWKSIRVMLWGVLAMTQGRLEIILIEHYMGFDSVGKFSAALRIVDLFDILTVTLISILLPRYASAKKIDNEKIARLTYLLGIFVFICSIPLIIGSILIFPFIFGEKYNIPYYILLLLMLKPFFVMICHIRNMFLVLNNSFWYQPVSASIGLLFAGIIGVLLIPTYGLLGGAIMTVGGWFASSILSDLFLYRKNLNIILSSYTECSNLFSRILNAIYRRKV